MKSDYSNGKIYKIEPIQDYEDENDVYYGSTCQSLSKRMAQHKANYQGFKLGKYKKCTVYDIFDKYGVESCQILLVENYDCKSIEELHAREGHFIRNNKCINKCIAGRTKIQYNEENKEKLKEAKKRNYEANKTVILQKQKEYHLKNLEKRKEYEQSYRSINKDKISNKNKAVCDCECGKTYTYRNWARHRQSTFHMNYMNNKDVIKSEEHS